MTLGVGLGLGVGELVPVGVGDGVAVRVGEGVAVPVGDGFAVDADGVGEGVVGIWAPVVIGVAAFTCGLRRWAEFRGASAAAAAGAEHLLAACRRAGCAPAISMPARPEEKTEIPATAPSAWLLASRVLMGAPSP